MGGDVEPELVVVEGAEADTGDLLAVRLFGVDDDMAAAGSGL